MSSPAPRIGLFGGSFDPPHAGHLAVARHARDCCRLERVVWMPAARSPFKREQAPRASDAQRLELLRLLLRSEPGMEISSLELERGGPSYTIDTVESLQRQLPADTRLVLIIGEDNWAQLPAWHRARELLERVELLIVHRSAAARGDPAWAAKYQASFVPMPAVDLSSSALRDALVGAQAAPPGIAPELFAYMQAQRLYGVAPA